MPRTKMIQSNTLSQQPDFIPKEDHDNENRILLPEEMFINLLDTDLQARIADADNYDFDVKNALEMLLERFLHRWIQMGIDTRWLSY